MKLYEKALFDAFVWSQAVEEMIRDLIIELCDTGRLNLTKKQHSKVENMTLGGLVKALTPCAKMLQPFVKSGFYDRLRGLQTSRNDVVHRSSYVKNIFAWSAGQSKQDVKQEMLRLKEIKLVAGDLFGELVDAWDGLVT